MCLVVYFVAKDLDRHFEYLLDDPQSENNVDLRCKISSYSIC